MGKALKIFSKVEIDSNIMRSDKAVMEGSSPPLGNFFKKIFDFFIEKDIYRIQQRKLTAR